MATRIGMPRRPGILTGIRMGTLRGLDIVARAQDIVEVDCDGNGP